MTVRTVEVGHPSTSFPPDSARRGCGHLLGPLVSAWKAVPPGIPLIQQKGVNHYNSTMRDTGSRTGSIELGFGRAGMTQRSEQPARAVSNQPFRGLLDLRSISTNPLERHCTRPGREQASKGRTDDLTDWSSICSLRAEPRAGISRRWLQSPWSEPPSQRSGSSSCACGHTP